VRNWPFFGIGLVIEYRSGLIDDRIKKMLRDVVEMP